MCFVGFTQQEQKNILMPLWCWFPDSLSKCENKQTQSRPHVPSYFPIHGVLEARLSSRHDKEESNALTLIIQHPSRIDFHTLLTASAVYHWDSYGYKQRASFRCSGFDKIFPPCKEMHKPKTNSLGFSVIRCSLLLMLIP